MHVQDAMRSVKKAMDQASEIDSNRTEVTVSRKNYQDAVKSVKSELERVSKIVSIVRGVANELKKSKVEGKKHLTSIVQNFKKVGALAIDCGIRSQPDVSHVLKEAEDAIEEVRQALNGSSSKLIRSSLSIAASKMKNASVKIKNEKIIKEKADQARKLARVVVIPLEKKIVEMKVKIDLIGIDGSSVPVTNAVAAAEKSLKKAINISPNFELAKWNLSNCQLLLGNFQEGFLNFESRRKLDFWEKRNLIIPELENLNQVVGKKILIISEQGLGDTIQFARIGKWIADLGGIVTLEVQNPLKGLIYESKNFRVVPKNQLQAEYDYFLPLLSGIKFFINSNTDRSKVTEIVSDINYNLKWKNFFSHRKFKIGISWQGNPTHKDDQRGNKFSRSFDLQNLKFLSKLENVEIFNLQKNDGYNQIQEYGYSDFINDFGSNFDKGEYAFCDTVSIIKNLDLVITCDTSLAHLAGSLNKPVWTALKYTPDWRWLLNTSATKWYPSMKLYRQKELGNWSDVFKEIENDLNILLNSQKFVMA